MIIPPLHPGRMGAGLAWPGFGNPQPTALQIQADRVQQATHRRTDGARDHRASGGLRAGRGRPGPGAPAVDEEQTRQIQYQSLSRDVSGQPRALGENAQRSRDPGVFTLGLQAALAFSAGGQVKRDRGAGTASAGQNPHPVGYLPDEPQAVAGPARQRVP